MSFCQQEVLFALLDHNIVYLQGKRVCRFTHYTIMCIFDVVFILEALCLCLFSGGWDRYGRKTYPHSATSVTLQSHSLQLFFFLHSTHCIFLPQSRRQTHTRTRSHSPCSPPLVAESRAGRSRAYEAGSESRRRGWGWGGQPGENLPWFSLLKLFSSGWQIRGDTSTRGDCTQLRGWGWTTIICPPLMLVKLFLMLARREGLKYN